MCSKLQIVPSSKLLFKGPYTTPSTTILKLTNISNERLAYTIRTHPQEYYYVKENKGFLESYDTTATIHVVFSPKHTDDLLNNDIKGKLKVKWIVVPDTYKDDCESFWEGYVWQLENMKSSVLECILVDWSTVGTSTEDFLSTNDEVDDEDYDKNTNQSETKEAQVETNTQKIDQTKSFQKPQGLIITQNTQQIQSPQTTQLSKKTQIQPLKTDRQQPYDLWSKYFKKSISLRDKRSSFQTSTTHASGKEKKKRLTSNQPLVYTQQQQSHTQPQPQQSHTQPQPQQSHTQPQPQQSQAQPQPQLPQARPPLQLSKIQPQSRQKQGLNSTDHIAGSVDVRIGDLTTEKVDVIVVPKSSTVLIQNIIKAAGDEVKNLYDEELQKNPNVPLTTITAGGQLAAEKIYFLPCPSIAFLTYMCTSVKKVISDAMKQANYENRQSIAFPAIGCNIHRSNIDLIAQTMIHEVYNNLTQYPMSVVIVIQSERLDIYQAFRKEIDQYQKGKQLSNVSHVSIPIGCGKIEVEKGDITTQKVDVIVGTTTSMHLKKAIINAAGSEVQVAYDAEEQKNQNNNLISISPGQLPCNRIFFIKWQPDVNLHVLRKSVIDFISIAIQNAVAYNFTSIAIPIIGCGIYGHSVDLIAKIMVAEVKMQLTNLNTPLLVKFIVKSDHEGAYEKCCQQLLTNQRNFHKTFDNCLPITWESGTNKQIRFILVQNSSEYQSIFTTFNIAMQSLYSKIIRIERIQNERCYLQYTIHKQAFEENFNKDTEKCLYHGCPEQAAMAIVKDGFNRNFAGVHGTSFGVGVYFSSLASYSHSYATPNLLSERYMFVSRVLIGNTCGGNSSMKSPPSGFDSTTDGSHIFVTYHDAQAYPEYLIVYQ